MLVVKVWLLSSEASTMLSLLREVLLHSKGAVLLLLELC